MWKKTGVSIETGPGEVWDEYEDTSIIIWKPVNLPAYDGRVAEEMKEEMLHVLEVLRKWKDGEETRLVDAPTRLLGSRKKVHPNFPGWAFDYDGPEEIRPDTTFSAHYQDHFAGKTRFWVPTVYIWGTSGKSELGGFVRFRAGECGWCGTPLDVESQWGIECPNCGGN